MYRGKEVMEERSLNTSNKVAFQQKVSQVILSSPYLKPEDWLYTLTAKGKNSNAFTRLETFANAGGKKACLCY